MVGSQHEINKRYLSKTLGFPARSGHNLFLPWFGSLRGPIRRRQGPDKQRGPLPDRTGQPDNANADEQSATWSNRSVQQISSACCAGSSLPIGLW